MQAVYHICTQSSCGTASYIKAEEFDGSTSYYILTAAHILCNDDGDICSPTAAVRRISIGEPTNWYGTPVVHIDWAKDVALLNPVTELRQVYASHDFNLQASEWFDTALPVGFLPSHGASMVAIASNGLAIEMVNDRESYSGSCSRPDYCEPVLGQALGGTSGSPIIGADGSVVGIITGVGRVTVSISRLLPGTGSYRSSAMPRPPRQLRHYLHQLPQCRRHCLRYKPPRLTRTLFAKRPQYRMGWMPYTRFALSKPAAPHPTLDSQSLTVPSLTTFSPLLMYFASKAAIGAQAMLLCGGSLAAQPNGTRHDCFTLTGLKISRC